MKPTLEQLLALSKAVHTLFDGVDTSYVCSVLSNVMCSTLVADLWNNDGMQHLPVMKAALLEDIAKGMDTTELEIRGYKDHHRGN